MTERTHARSRWSLGRIRLAAWGSVATAFVGLVGILGIAPKPATAEANAAAAGAQRRPATTQRTAGEPTVRRIVKVTPHHTAPVKVVDPAPPALSPPQRTGGS
jgi:hypothetical protein